MFNRFTVSFATALTILGAIVVPGASAQEVYRSESEHTGTNRNLNLNAGFQFGGTASAETDYMGTNVIQVGSCRVEVAPDADATNILGLFAWASTRQQDLSADQRAALYSCLSEERAATFVPTLLSSGDQHVINFAAGILFDGMLTGRQLSSEEITRYMVIWTADGVEAFVGGRNQEVDAELRATIAREVVLRWAQTFARETPALATPASTPVSSPAAAPSPISQPSTGSVNPTLNL